MDTSPAAQSSEVSEPQPAFRKPSNDTSRRNYRRHSPSTSRSCSPPSAGAWKRGRSPSFLNSQDDGGLKTADSVKRGRRSERGREVDREAAGIRDSRVDVGYSDSRNKKHYSSNYDDHIHGRHSSYYDHKGSRSNSCFWRDDYGRSCRVECRSPSRNYREKDYDDRWRSGRIDDWNSEWSYRERGNEKNRDRGKFWNDDRDRDGDRQRDRDNDMDKYKDRDLCLERGKSGSRCPDVDPDADLEISRDSDWSRENVRDRSKHREKDDRHRYREQSKGRGKDCGHKKEEDLHMDTDEVKGCGWKKELGRQIVEENLKEPAYSKEREDTKEKDMVRDDQNYQYRDSHCRNEEYERDQNYSHHYDTVKDGRKSNMGREREHKHSRDKNQSDGESGQDNISSKEKCQNKSLVHAKERPSLGSSEGADKAETVTLHSKCKRLGFLTSDILLSTEDVANGTSLGGNLHDNGLDLTQGQAKHSPGTSGGTPGKTSKWGPEARPSSEVVASTALEAEVATDLNAATLAAMRAAELVNKNLGTGVFSSADQKKKLLWGSKKNAAAQEAAAGTNRWSTVHFPDPDRQEKFNKLMGVKGDFCVDEDKEKESGLAAQRQMELQQDLEKQFTAGMRRRDGRTVGLGL